MLFINKMKLNIDDTSKVNSGLAGCDGVIETIMEVFYMVSLVS